MITICIFSGTPSTDNEHGIENKLKNFSLALKSKNLESNWSFKSEMVMGRLPFFFVVSKNSEEI